MNNLLSEIEKMEAVSLLEKSYQEASPTFVYGVSDNFKAHLALSLFLKIDKPLLFLTENKNKADRLISEINALYRDLAFYFPAKEVNFYNIKSLDDKSESQRLEILLKLLAGEKFILVTTPQAMTNKLSPRKILRENSLTLDLDSEVDLKDLKNRLLFLGYEYSSLVESKGQYSIRGSIVDLRPANYDDPVRIELFDTEIDSIRTFDKDSQRSIEKLDELCLTPVSELLYSKEDFSKVIKNIGKDLEKYGGRPDFQKFEDKYRQISEFLEEGLSIPNIDLINAYRKDNFESLLDYLSDDFFIISDDIGRIYENSRDYEAKFMTDLTFQIDNGEVSPSFEKVRFSLSSILKDLEAFPFINFSSILKNTKLKPKKIIEIKSLEEENFNRQFDSFIGRLIENSEKGDRQYVCLSNEESRKNVKDSLRARGYFKVREKDEKIDRGEISLLNFDSQLGYYLPDLGLHLFTHREIFGRSRISSHKKKKISSRDIINYSDLEIGDYVVHEKSGIGIYQGIEKIEVNSILKDYLVIEYKGNDKLYVPMDQMNLVSKYIGNGGGSPKISALGGVGREKAKSKAKKSVDAIADDIVKLYAKRSTERGIKFSPDTVWQREFEDSFPYEETESQLRSIKEIKGDMENERPMDRLLCGDVGYGKTEVALRAAFKAINDGYQVAFLVPTTILAKQHFETMKERYADYPIECAMMSRFTTKLEQENNIKGIKSGKVDIVVGTHRLLSKDIKFKNLGLLIIDEEQRFGVKHKEQLKSLKENIDCLTLTATPIPRTLQMSLAGIRDLSTLDEPPEERLPVNTYVLEYDENIIGQAIENELNRDGQVYFVYNRVNNIEKLEGHIRQLVPEARIAIAHGQMSSRQLEDIMTDFSDGKIDILLSTTIIETGMDIQNVNTLIVYDSDMMGLGQLYQLKGRIGRSSRSSYAYFTYRKNKVLTEIGEKRLKSIKDFSDFGSGYKIAMKDLELRGAGNLLGESQSGYVESVGYDLYVKYLQEAIENAKGSQPEIVGQKDIYIDIKVDAYIPSEYISDQGQKIEMYKRIASISQKEDYDILVEDLIDRYGDIPVMVDNLMYISLIKSKAENLDFDEIREKNGMIYLSFKNRDKYSFEQLAMINDCFGPGFELDLSNSPSFKVKANKYKLVDTLNLLEVIDKVERKENE